MLSEFLTNASDGVVVTAVLIPVIVFVISIISLCVGAGVIEHMRIKKPLKFWRWWLEVCRQVQSMKLTKLRCKYYDPSEQELKGRPIHHDLELRIAKYGYGETEGVVGIEFLAFYAVKFTATLFAFLPLFLLFIGFLILKVLLGTLIGFYILLIVGAVAGICMGLYALSRLIIWGGNRLESGYDKIKTISEKLEGGVK